MVKTWYFSSSGHAFAAVCGLPTQAPRSHYVSPDVEASQRARILSLPAEPPDLILWFNQVTQQFCGESPQTPRADSNCEPLPCFGSSPRLCHAFLTSMWPILDTVWPPGPLSQAYLSLHSLEGLQG
jgi:hypothetical protein